MEVVAPTHARPWTAQSASPCGAHPDAAASLAVWPLVQLAVNRRRRSTAMAGLGALGRGAAGGWEPGAFACTPDEAPGEAEAAVKARVGLPLRRQPPAATANTAPAPTPCGDSLPPTPAVAHAPPCCPPSAARLLGGRACPTALRQTQLTRLPPAPARSRARPTRTRCPSAVPWIWTWSARLNRRCAPWWTRHGCGRVGGAPLSTAGRGERAAMPTALALPLAPPRRACCVSWTQRWCSAT